MSLLAQTLAAGLIISPEIERLHGSSRLWEEGRDGVYDRVPWLPVARFHFLASGAMDTRPGG